MKYKSESIDRLEGDIYEFCSGQFIDMRSIISIGIVDEDADKYGSAFIVYCRLLEKPIYIWYDFVHKNFRKAMGATISDVDLEQTIKNTNDRRDEFIEVWKHWKSINKTG